MKKIFALILFILFYIIKCPSMVKANYFDINDNVYAYQKGNDIVTYLNNVYIKTIYDAKLLDVDDNCFLFNKENKIYLFNLDTLKELYIDDGYNALINENIIIYENDNNVEYRCRNIINNETRNCYKLYKYELNLNNKEYLDIVGDDIYLNDLENSLVVYNSIHYRDKYCTSMCSFVGIYSIEDNSNLLLDNYTGIELNISGNAFISENIVVFESLLSITDCNGTQMLFYDLETKSFDMLLNDGTCFNKDIEILEFNDLYLIFKSNFNNYDNNDKLIYVYSVEDRKYDEIGVDLMYAKLLNGEIIYLINNSLHYQKIDTKPPYIDESVSYDFLLGKEELLKNNLKVKDNLSSKDNISIKIPEVLVKGERYISIELCDRFNNCQNYSLLVNVVEVDNEKPNIYMNDNIKIKKGESFDINDYGYSIDNIDGRINLYFEEKIDFDRTGEYSVVVKSQDSSGNVASKKISIIIYEDTLIFKLYIVTILVSILMVLIIYIFRFKKAV